MTNIKAVTGLSTTLEQRENTDLPIVQSCGWETHTVVELHVVFDKLQSLGNRLGQEEHITISEMRNVLCKIAVGTNNDPMSHDEALKRWHDPIYWSWEDRYSEAPEVGVFWRRDKREWAAFGFEALQRLLDRVERSFNETPRRQHDEYRILRRLFENLLIQFIQRQEARVF